MSEDRWCLDSYEAGRYAGLDNLPRSAPMHWKSEEEDWLAGYDCGQKQYRECVDKASRMTENPPS